MEIKKGKYVCNIGEAFAYRDKVLVCVTDRAKDVCYFKRAGLKKECLNFACSKSERDDQKGVKFIEYKGK